jgi:ATP-binding cassette subfamily F protein 3
MRMLSGEEAPDSGTCTAGHQVVMEYFAQDEATRLEPALTVYETLEAGSPNAGSPPRTPARWGASDMVPAIRNILGGFLFSGDDVYKKAGVLSGGERTRLAVARMLLRPSNTLLLDEPTNHLDLDSKDVLLDALEDYGGTLIIVSHDRYFVEKLATKIIEIGHGEALVYPGTYSEFLWHKDHPQEIPKPKTQIPTPKTPASAKAPARQAPRQLEPRRSDQGAAEPRRSGEAARLRQGSGEAGTRIDREARKREETERRKKQRATESLHKRIADLERRIAEREAQVKELEAAMGAAGFYDDPAAATAAIDRHTVLMWEVGDLMAQWEALQEHASES